MAEMREQYVALIDQFNWNKLVYEARLVFDRSSARPDHLYQGGMDSPSP